MRKWLVNNTSVYFFSSSDLLEHDFMKKTAREKRWSARVSRLECTRSPRPVDRRRPQCPVSYPDNNSASHLFFPSLTSPKYVMIIELCDVCSNKCFPLKAKFQSKSQASGKASAWAIKLKMAKNKNRRSTIKAGLLFDRAWEIITMVKWLKQWKARERRSVIASH